MNPCRSRCVEPEVVAWSCLHPRECRVPMLKRIGRKRLGDARCFSIAAVLVADEAGDGAVGADLKRQLHVFSPSEEVSRPLRKELRDAAAWEIHEKMVVLALHFEISQRRKLI